MISFVDETEALEQRKDARMEQRTKPHVKEKIQQAAALLGIDETAFVTSAAYRKAQDVIDEHCQTRLSQTDLDQVMTALDNPPDPTHDLKAILSLHERTVTSEE